MECSSSSSLLIPCKFCNRKSFDSQSRLCEHEVEEHGYVRPCTVTTPKVTPSRATTSGRKKDLDSFNLSDSDPQSNQALWAEWTQETEKLFREYVLNTKTSRSITLPENFSNSSYYLNLVPDYSSADFPTGLSIVSTSPVVVGNDPGVESVFAPATIDFQTVPLVYQLEDNLQAFTIGSNENDVNVPTADPVLIPLPVIATSVVNDMNVVNEEVILIATSSSDEEVEAGTIFQPAGTNIVDSSVALELPATQVVLDQVTGQLVIPNNLILEAGSVLPAPVTNVQVATPTMLDEATGEFILADGTRIQAVSTVVVNEHGDVVAVPVSMIQDGEFENVISDVSLAPKEPSNVDNACINLSDEQFVVTNSCSETKAVEISTLQHASLHINTESDATNLDIAEDAPPEEEMRFQINSPEVSVAFPLVEIDEDGPLCSLMKVWGTVVNETSHNDMETDANISTVHSFFDETCQRIGVSTSTESPQSVFLSNQLVSQSIPKPSCELKGEEEMDKKRVKSTGVEQVNAASTHSLMVEKTAKPLYKEMKKSTKNNNKKKEEIMKRALRSTSLPMKTRSRPNVKNPSF